MTRTLVTGSAGRLGRSVVATLAAAGHEVIGVDTVVDTMVNTAQAIMGTPREAAATLPADLTDLGETYEALARFQPDAVVHLAAIAVPFSRTDALTFRVNTQLAFNVCEAATALGVERVVVASSPTVIGYGHRGWTPAYLPIDEEHPLRPWNAYSLSKLVAEQTMLSFARRQEATRFAAIRPCFIVAPEEWEGAPTQSGHTIVERLDKPEIASVSLFNYVDARDAAELIQILIDRLPDLANGEIFFVGASDALARAPLAELLPYGDAPTGTAPAFSTGKAGRLLGWQAKRSWRTELS